MRGEVFGAGGTEGTSEVAQQHCHLRPTGEETELIEKEWPSGSEPSIGQWGVEGREGRVECTPGLQV